MSKMVGRTAVPISFPSAAGACVGWWHAGVQPLRPSVVVLCRPLGYEALCSYRTYTQLAQTLAQAGFDVLRFDYHGTGDSPGGDDDPGRVEAWLASVEAAIQQARALSGASTVSLFGLRLGATLAVEAARRLGGVANLMLWAPCASGKAFLREMRAAQAGRAGPADGSLEALGMRYSAQTVNGLQALAAEPLQAAPAGRVLFVARDDLPGEGPLPAKFRALGADVTCCTWPGYAGMMAEPHEAALPADTLASITDWLCSEHPPEDRARGAAPVAGYAALPSGCVAESSLQFGPHGGLYGVLTEPSTAAAPRERRETAVLMLNVGGNYRIGPNRNYVKWARALATDGYRVLRMDVRGVGDSRASEDFTSASMYRRDAVADVRAAMDLLEARGCRRFWLVGICSGSYLAFETALADQRVSGQVLMNSRLLEWDSGRSGPWQTSMQSYYKSTQYYRRALLRSDVYGRLLRGQVNVRGIANRLWGLFAARVQRAVTRTLRMGPPPEGVLRKWKHLSARGVDSLVIMSDQDDGLDYIEFHLGSRGARMRGHENFRMVMVPDADHTFSSCAGQKTVIEVLRKHLEALHTNRSAAAEVAARVATT